MSVGWLVGPGGWPQRNTDFFRHLSFGAGDNFADAVCTWIDLHRLEPTGARGLVDAFTSALELGGPKAVVELMREDQNEYYRRAVVCVAERAFTAAKVGERLFITGASDPKNNGTFVVTSIK